MSISFPFSSGITLPSTLASVHQWQWDDVLDCPLAIMPQFSKWTIHSFLGVDGMDYGHETVYDANLSWWRRPGGQAIGSTLLMILRELSYFSLFATITNGDISKRNGDYGPLDDPHFKWGPAFSRVVKTPVDSMSYPTLASPHFMLVSSCFWKMVMAFQLIMFFPFLPLMMPLNLPGVESYLNI